MLTRILIITAIVAAMVSCGHDTPRQERPPTPVTPPGSSGDRPDVGAEDSFDQELKDPVWRYEGGAVKLRYDRAGVLVKTDCKGNVSFTDLDGAAEVKACTGSVQADSTCRGASLNVNGTTLELLKFKFMHRTEESVWYSVMAADSSQLVLVTPV